MMRRVVRRMDPSDLARMPRKLVPESKILQREFAAQYLRKVLRLNPQSKVEVQRAWFPSAAHLLIKGLTFT